MNKGLLKAWGTVRQSDATTNITPVLAFNPAESLLNSTSFNHFRGGKTCKTSNNSFLKILQIIANNTSHSKRVILNFKRWLTYSTRFQPKKNTTEFDANPSISSISNWLAQHSHLGLLLLINLDPNGYDRHLLHYRDFTNFETIHNQWKYAKCPRRSI